MTIIDSIKGSITRSYSTITSGTSGNKLLTCCLNWHILEKKFNWKKYKASKSGSVKRTINLLNSGRSDFNWLFKPSYSSLNSWKMPSALVKAVKSAFPASTFSLVL
eukprot:Lithocolla_globosa_v1_NODE_3061_length_1778_cov_8.731863.p2 type:complete len:106 gc:universal NODE_3061_length_1778_cov_8.731863:1278-961(-)